MQKEEDCEPSERFLQAIMQFPDNTVKKWKGETIRRLEGKEKGTHYDTFINWERKQTEVAVFTTYAYADLSIPMSFDCIFRYDRPEIFTRAPFVITQSILEAWYPTDDIGHGHKHLCILAFEKSIPTIIEVLHKETNFFSSWTWDAKKVLGICQFKDLQTITKVRHNDRNLHGGN